MKLIIIGIPEKRPTFMTRPFEPKTPKKQRKMNASANKHSEEDSSSSSDTVSDHSNHSMLDVTSRPSSF